MGIFPLAGRLWVGEWARKGKNAAGCAMAFFRRDALWKPMRQKMMRINRACVAGLITCAVPVAWANPGHEITVAELSASIAQSPAIPELYFQRAWNYREMGRQAEARADWEKTLELNAGFLPASRELARSDASEGRVEAGIDRLRQALAMAPEDQAFHRPGCFSVLAELLLKMGKNAEALEEVRAGLAAAPDLQMDLCLLRSEAQRRLGQHKERVQNLEEAMRKLRSFVVRTRWYDALIDAGRGAEILPEVEKEIANTRYQAAWLIRRAKIRLHAGETAGATEDLNAALTEIESRLRPENPDLSLICERGLIHALAGKHDAALADLGLARRAGADIWMLMPLEALVGDTPGLPKPGSGVVPLDSGESLKRFENGK